MDFFSRIKSGLSTAGSLLSNTFSRLGSFGSQIAGAAGSLSIGQDDNIKSPPSGPQSTLPPPSLSINPNVPTGTGLIQSALTAPRITPVGQTKLPAPSLSIFPQGSSGVNPGDPLGGIRPAITAVTKGKAGTFTPESPIGRGEIRTDASGNQFIADPETGRRIITPQGFEGQQGTSALSVANLPGFSSQQVAAQGAPGTSGGRSAFTGLLGASGSGIGTPAPVSPDDEDQRGTTGEGGIQTFKGSTPDSLSINPALFGGLPPLNAPLPGQNINAAQLQVSPQTRTVLNSPQALSANDIQDTINTIQDEALRIKGVLDAMNPTPDIPVIDTQAQLDFLNQFEGPEQFDVRARMDQVRQQVGLPQMEQQRVEALKELNAITQVYQTITDDIKNNPDFPKGLAQRRLAQVAEQQKLASMQLLGQLEILGLQINDANQAVDREFDIIEFEADQARRDQQLVRDNLNFIVSSGAIAGFDNEDIQVWAQKTGIPPVALAAVRDEALRPEFDIRTVGDNIVRIDKKTGQAETIFSAPEAIGAGIGTLPGEVGIPTQVGNFIPNQELNTSQQKTVDSIRTGLSLVEQAERLYQEAVGDEFTGTGSGLVSRLKGIGRTAGAITGLNQSFAAYQRFLDSNRAPIAKGIKGESGNLAENEQRQALKAFPSAFSSPLEAQIAFDEIRQQMRDQLSVFGSFGDSQGGGANDPLGIL